MLFIKRINFAQNIVLQFDCTLKKFDCYKLTLCKFQEIFMADVSQKRAHLEKTASTENVCPE